MKRLVLLPLICACEGAQIDPTADACDRARAAAGSMLAATAARSAAPELAIGSGPAIVPLALDRPAYVKTTVAGDTPAVLYVKKKDVLTGLSFGDSGDEVEPRPAGAPVAECPAEIEAHYDLDLHEAGTWVFRLGPSALPSVWLMLSSAEGHED